MQNKEWRKTFTALNEWIIIADLLQSEGLLSVKRIDRTVLPCYTSEMKREELAKPSVAPERCWMKTVTIVSSNGQLRNLTKSQSQHLKQTSVFLMILCCSNFSLGYP